MDGTHAMILLALGPLFFPARSEKRLQKFRATGGEYSATDLYLMIQVRMVQNLNCGMHCARFRIIRTINQPPQTRVHQRAGTHGTRFNGDKHFAFTEPIVSEALARFAQSQNFRVRRGIGIGDIAIPSASHDAAITHDNRSHRHFSGLTGALRTPQSFFHEEFVVRRYFTHSNKPLNRRGSIL